jgi:hypothetical protein
VSMATASLGGYIAHEYVAMNVYIKVSPLLYSAYTSKFLCINGL